MRIAYLAPAPGHGDRRQPQRQTRAVLWGRDAAQCRAIAAVRRNERYLPEMRCRRSSRSRPNLPLRFPLLNWCWWRRRRRRLPTCSTGSRPCAALGVAVQGIRCAKRELPHQVAARVLPPAAPMACSPARASRWRSRADCRRRSRSPPPMPARQATARALPASPARLLQPRCRRRGSGRGGKERHGHRHRHRRRPGARRQRARRPDYPRPGRRSRAWAWLGGRTETFTGLTGAGRSDPDLHRRAVAQPPRRPRPAARQKLDDILADLGQVAEGVATARELTRSRTTRRRHADHAGGSPVLLDRVCAAGGGRGAAQARPRAETTIPHRQIPAAARPRIPPPPPRWRDSDCGCREAAAGAGAVPPAGCRESPGGRPRVSGPNSNASPSRYSASV